MVSTVAKVRTQNSAVSVAHLSSLRGFTLEQIDELLVHRLSNSAPPSPRHDEAAPSALDAAPALPPAMATGAALLPPLVAAPEAPVDVTDADDTQPPRGAGANPSENEVAALRRALERAEAQAARGERVDAEAALKKELLAHTSDRHAGVSLSLIHI